MIALSSNVFFLDDEGFGNGYTEKVLFNFTNPMFSSGIIWIA